MQTRVKQLAVCLCTGGVAEVSLQLPERLAQGTCTYSKMGGGGSITNIRHFWKQKLSGHASN
jgi:hypothetical protein